jgi:hypothetical protein
MKNVLFAAATVMMIGSVAPAFANPSQEAEEDYAGWLAAERAAERATVNHQHNGHVIYRSHHQVGAR